MPSAGARVACKFRAARSDLRKPLELRWQRGCRSVFSWSPVCLRLYPKATWPGIRYLKAEGLFGIGHSADGIRVSGNWVCSGKEAFDGPFGFFLVGSVCDSADHGDGPVVVELAEALEF